MPEPIGTRRVDTLEELEKMAGQETVTLYSAASDTVATMIIMARARKMPDNHMISAILSGAITAIISEGLVSKSDLKIVLQGFSNSLAEVTKH